jgi:hypothetical protein
VVAKPRSLRRTPWAGNAFTYQDGQEVSYVYSNGYTRVATDTSTSEFEVQSVTPGWFVGDIIRANKRTVRVTIDGNLSDALYEDINASARTWAAVAGEE